MTETISGVSLPTGKLAFPLTLASLSGPNHFGTDITLQYSTNHLLKKVKTWNQDAPTGILGLGWSLSNPYIIRVGNGSLDDQFLFGGPEGVQSLVLTERTITDEHIWQQTFVTKNQSLLKFVYYSKEGDKTSEKWEVTTGDGTVFVYGDNETAIDWGVRWIGDKNNDALCEDPPAIWLGSSLETEGQEHYALIWNLSKISNRFGQEIQFSYTQQQENVGVHGHGLSYTQASYLDKIQVVNGESVRFYYGEKESWEQAESWSKLEDGKITNAFQGKLETKYLQKIVVFNENALAQQRIEFGYDFLNKKNHILAKRILTRIHKKNRTGTSLEPPTLFHYWGQDNEVSVERTKDHVFDAKKGALYGHLKSVTTPLGATTTYSYQKMPGIAPDAESWNIKRDLLNIPLPPKMKEKHDDETITIAWDWEHFRVHWGTDGYVVLSWGSKEDSRSRIYIAIYEWLGEWKKVFGEKFVVKKTSAKYSQISTGTGIFAFIRRDFDDKGAGMPAVWLFSRDPYIPGKWNKHGFEKGLCLYTGDDGKNKEARVRVGNNVVGVVNQVVGHLYCYGFHGRTFDENGNPQSPWERMEQKFYGRSGTKEHLTPAASGNYIVALAVFGYHQRAKDRPPQLGVYRYDLDYVAKGEKQAWITKFYKPICQFSVYSSSRHPQRYAVEPDNVQIYPGVGYLLIVPEVHKSHHLGKHPGIGRGPSYITPLVLTWKENNFSLHLQKIHTPKGGFGYSDTDLGNISNSNTITIAEEKQKYLYRYQGGGKPGLNKGWNYHKFTNSDHNENPWARMSVADMTVVIKETGIIGRERFSLSQYDPMGNSKTGYWFPQKNVHFSSITDHLDEAHIINIILLTLSLIPVVGEVTMPITALVGSVIEDAAIRFLVEQAVGQAEGALQGQIESEIMKSLYSGQRTGVDLGTDYLIVGQKGKQPAAYYKKWSSTSKQFVWESAGTLDLERRGRAPVDVFSMGSSFLLYAYRVVDRNFKEHWIRYIYEQEIDQVVFFRNGHLYKQRGLPLSTIGRIDDNKRMPYMIASAQDSLYSFFAPWGGILGYANKSEKDHTIRGGLKVKIGAPLGIGDHTKRLALLMAMDEDIVGALDSYVVDKVVVADGYQKYQTHFQYTAQNASYQQALGTAMYNQVSVAQGSDNFDSSKSLFGCTEYYFYNGGLANANDPDNQLPYDPANDSSNPTNIAQYYNLATGQLYCQRSLDSQGQEVARKTIFYQVYFKTLQQRRVWKIVPVREANLLDQATTIMDYYYDYKGVRGATDKQTGLLTSTSITNHNPNPEHLSELFCTDYKYGFEVCKCKDGSKVYLYQAMWDQNIISPIVQTTKVRYLNPPVQYGEELPPGQYLSSSVQTWGAWNEDGENSYWIPLAHYSWRGSTEGGVPTGSPNFTNWCNNNDNWQKDWVKNVTPLVIHNGIVLEAQDALQTSSSTIYDRRLIDPVYQVTNARVSLGQAFYCGFEPYEDTSGWFAKPKGLEDMYYMADYYTGSRCIQLGADDCIGYQLDYPPIGTLPKYYDGTLGFFYKTNSSSASLMIRISFPEISWVSAAPLVERTLSTDTLQANGTWQYILVPFTLPLEPGEIEQITYVIENQDSHPILLDNIMGRPLSASDSSLQVYDRQHQRLQAAIHENGITMRLIYRDDQYHTQIATVKGKGDTQEPIELQASYASRNDKTIVKPKKPAKFNPEKPNSQLTIVPQSGGDYFDFRGGEEDRRGWSGGRIQDRTLVLRGGETSSYTYNGGNAGVRVQLRGEKEAQQFHGDRVSISLGELTVSYSASSKQFTLTYNNNPIGKPFETSQLLSDWLLMQIENTAYFFANGQQIFGELLAPFPVSEPEKTIKFELSGNPNVGLGFKDIIVFYDPIVDIQYLDGVGKVRQTQALVEVEGIEKKRIKRNIEKAVPYIEEHIEKNKSKICAEAAKKPHDYPVTAGNNKTITIPKGVHYIYVQIAGGQGGNYDNCYYHSSIHTKGGYGYCYEAIVPVTPGSTLEVYAGAAGKSQCYSNFQNQYIAGYGGAASSIQMTVNGEKQWLIVAGGGGGATINYNGGNATGFSYGENGGNSSVNGGYGGHDGNAGKTGSAGGYPCGGQGVNSVKMPPILGGTTNTSEGGGGGGYSGGGGGSSGSGAGSGGGGGSCTIAKTIICKHGATNDSGGGFVYITILDARDVNKIAEDVKKAEPKNVTQSYADNQLTVSWEGPENKSYDVKVVNAQDKTHQLGFATSDTTQYPFPTDDLAQSEEGMYLIAAVRTLIAEKGHTRYIDAEPPNYRLGQAIIDTLTYNSDDSTLTGTWTPPAPLDSSNPDENATGYEYKILDDASDVIADQIVNDPSGRISIQIGLTSGTYKFQIRATGEEQVIPGAWSEPTEIIIVKGGDHETITIPSGVTCMHVQIAGGAGGDGAGGGSGSGQPKNAHGGNGCVGAASFIVKPGGILEPGSEITVYAGAKGSYHRGGGGGGGAASAIYKNGEGGERDWLIVAGGGGGTGGNGNWGGQDAQSESAGNPGYPVGNTKTSAGKGGSKGANGDKGVAYGGKGVNSGPPLSGGSRSGIAGGGGGGYSGGGGGGTWEVKPYNYTSGGNGGGGGSFSKVTLSSPFNATNESDGMVMLCLLR